MKNEIKKLFNKTNELEEQLEFISSITNNNSVSVSKKDFLNFSIIDEKIFNLCSIIINYQTTILINLKLSLYLPYNQDIEFELIINNNTIYKENKSCSTAQNNIEFVQSFFSQYMQNADIKIKIIPKDHKQIIFQNAIITIFGATINEDENEYRLCNRENDYLISFINDKKLYYQNCQKKEQSLSDSDFVYYSSCKSHCFVYDDVNKKTYLFRVDNDGNLFYMEFLKSEEKFICSSVDSVYAIYAKNRIFVTYISKYICYFFEISENIILNINSIKPVYGCKKSFVCYDSNKDKYYILITSKNDENYLLESIDEKSSGSEYLTYSNTFTITSIGDE